MRFFHTTVSWQFLTGVWVTASLLKSSGFFSVFWSISIMLLSLISKSSNPCTNPLATVPSAPITIGITVTFMFHSFFSSLAKSRYLFLFSLSFSFILWSAWTAGYLFFLLTMTRSDRLHEIRGSVCISKSQRILCVALSWGDCWFWMYHLFAWSNLNFLHIPTGSPSPLGRVKFYPLLSQIYCIRLSWDGSFRLYQHIIYIYSYIVTSSIFAMTELVLLALFCATMRRDSVSLFRFFYLSQIQGFTREISLVCRLNVHTVAFIPIFVF